MSNITSDTDFAMQAFFARDSTNEFSNSTFTNCIFNCVTVSMSFDNLYNNHFYKCVFVNCVFDRKKFDSCYFKDCLFIDCLFDRCKMNVCEIHNARIVNTVFNISVSERYIGEKLFKSTVFINCTLNKECKDLSSESIQGNIKVFNLTESSPEKSLYNENAINL